MKPLNHSLLLPLLAYRVQDKALRLGYLVRDVHNLLGRGRRRGRWAFFHSSSLVCVWFGGVCEETSDEDEEAGGEAEKKGDKKGCVPACGGFGEWMDEYMDER